MPTDLPPIRAPRATPPPTLRGLAGTLAVLAIGTLSAFAAYGMITSLSPTSVERTLAVCLETQSQTGRDCAQDHTDAEQHLTQVNRVRELLGDCTKDTPRGAGPTGLEIDRCVHERAAAERLPASAFRTSVNEAADGGTETK